MIGKENFAAGEELPAADQNQISKNANDAGGFRDTINAAETISAMRPVFLDDSSNTWKYCDANDTARLRFDGFILEAGSAGNAAKVQCSGIVRGLSSLDAGKNYYVQNDGTLGTTPGTYPIMVGVALSATELLIKKEVLYKIIASDDSVYGGPGFVGAGGLLAKVGEIVFNEIAGTIRTTVTLYHPGDGGSVIGRIYANGVAAGAIRQLDSGPNTQSWNEDLSFSPGDLIQFYFFGSGGNKTGNYEISYTKTPIVLPNAPTVNMP